jgi:hypothetical protein
MSLELMRERGSHRSENLESYILVISLLMLSMLI